MAAPVMIAPMALHGLVHEDGECATARAAEKCGIPLVRIITACLPVDQANALSVSPRLDRKISKIL